MAGRSLVVYVHIPKTAGTSLIRLLRRNQPAAARHVGNIFRAGGGINSPVPYERMVRGIESEPNVKVIHGHFPAGIDAALPSDWKLEFITFLREPIERAVSHYFQQLEMTNAIATSGRTNEDALTVGGLPRLTLETPIARAFSEIQYVPDNLQTRMLSGIPEPFGKVDEEMLLRAQENLREHFVMFGLTERFDESLILLKHRLGYTNVLYEELRVNAGRPRAKEIPAEMRKAAEDSNQFDLRLYEFASRAFVRSKEFREPKFQIDLAALRFAKTAEIGPPPRGFVPTWDKVVAERAARFEREYQISSALVDTLERAQKDIDEIEKLRKQVETQEVQRTKLQDDVARLQAKIGEMRMAAARRRTAVTEGKPKKAAAAAVDAETSKAPKAQKPPKAEKAPKGEARDTKNGAEPVKVKAAKKLTAETVLSRADELDRRTDVMTARLAELQDEIVSLRMVGRTSGGLSESDKRKLERQRREARELKNKIDEVKQQKDTLQSQADDGPTENVVAG